jgi:hypothetical protein
MLVVKPVEPVQRINIKITATQKTQKLLIVPQLEAGYKKSKFANQVKQEELGLTICVVCQQLLAESVSIVCAPTDPLRPSGTWRLTPYGMTYLAACTLLGFHEHKGAKEALYEEVPREQVMVREGDTCNVVDLREKAV